MWTRAIIVCDVFFDQRLQVALSQNQQLIHALTAHAADR
jgi:hypothetical protein